MRILYCHHGYFPFHAGAEAMTYRVAAAMQRRGHMVKIACHSTGNTRDISQNIDGVEVIGVRSLERAALQARIGWQPDIVHVVDAVWHNYTQAALSLARTWQAVFAITPASTVNAWQDISATMAVCRESDLVCVLTEAERELFQRYHVPSTRIVMIGQGPDLMGTPDAIRFRQTYGITGSMVLFLGRKIHFKGYKLVLAATTSVWTHFPNTFFTFIGPRVDADCTQIFSAFADPRIIEIGMVNDVEKHSALAACDLLCLPSTADVFPLVFVEAWACGKPVIASPFPGIEEIVRHEQDGLIVEADSTALALGIVRLLDNATEREVMGRSGFERVQQEFTWESVASRVEAAYDEQMRNVKMGKLSLSHND